MKIFFSSICIFLAAIFLASCGSAEDKPSSEASVDLEKMATNAAKVTAESKDQEEAAIDLYKQAEGKDIKVVLINDTVFASGSLDEKILGYTMRNNGEYADYGVYITKKERLACAGKVEKDSYYYQCEYTKAGKKSKIADKVSAVKG